MPRWSLQSEKLHYQYLCCNLSNVRLQICQDERSRMENFSAIHKLIDRVNEIISENRLLFYQDVAAIILSKAGTMMYEVNITFYSFFIAYFIRSLIFEFFYIFILQVV